MGQSFTIRILPSRSRMVALISPTFSFKSTPTSFLPSRISCRASRVHTGQSESVSLGQPSGGFVFWCDLSNGRSDHFGTKDGFWAILFRLLKTNHAPLAVTESPFSRYLIGGCMRVSSMSTQMEPWQAPNPLNDRPYWACHDYNSSERAGDYLNGH